MIKKKALRARMTKGSYLEVAKFKAAYFKNDNDCKRCDEEAALLAKKTEDHRRLESSKERHGQGQVPIDKVKKQRQQRGCPPG